MDKTYTVGAGGVVLNSKGQILVVSQQAVSWSLPKGHVEQGEDKLQAAKREIFEESGISDLEYLKDLGNYERSKIGDPSKLKRIYMFLFRTNQEDLKPIDKENPEARWVDVEEVATLLTAPKDKEFFLKVKDNIL